MRILFLADIIGQPGRLVVEKLLPQLKEKEGIDFCLANGENSAGGFGITPEVAYKLFGYGIDLITLGNHTWDRKDVYKIIESEGILRPANFPPGVPGKGWEVIIRKGKKLGVLNLQGRVYMACLDCPFRTADKVIEEIKKETNCILVDFHAEVTSEKKALGWYLDGRVSAVVGTHTHVPTADERILPQGTAYITDIGLCGSLDSVIGVKKEIAIQRFMTNIPFRFEMAKQNLALAGVVIELEEATGRARGIRRIEIGYSESFPT